MAESTQTAADFDDTNRSARRGRQLVKRLYGPRIFGLGLGFFCVARVLRDLQTPPVVWAALGFTCFLWPHIAYAWATRARQPFYAEHRNLLIDSLQAGLFVPLMHFNLVPSLAILVMMAMDNIAVGGVRLFVRGLLAQGAGIAITTAIIGIHWQPASSLAQIVACIPFLVLYPLLIGLLTFQLSTRLSIEKRQVELLSRTDGLTGIHNRAFFEQQLRAEFARCRRQHQPGALLLVDIDHFKRINDEGGHAAGDEVLRLISRLLRERLRPFDVIGRIGGEEFGIVLPGAERECAGQIAERLRAAVEKLRLPQPPYICTISIGLAVVQPDIADCENWQLRADRALYTAKQRGRNRVVGYDDHVQS